MLGNRRRGPEGERPLYATSGRPPAGTVSPARRPCQPTAIPPATAEGVGAKRFRGNVSAETSEIGWNVPGHREGAVAGWPGEPVAGPVVAVDSGPTRDDHDGPDGVRRQGGGGRRAGLVGRRGSRRSTTPSPGRSNGSSGWSSA